MAQPIFCDVCNIGVSSEVSMRDHVKGRRHQQTLGAMERRKSLARNSLYCHGFPLTMPTADLKAYFQRFGPVTRINVETLKGCYCIVQYDSEAPVQKALTQRNHLIQNCSLTVRPRKPITPHPHPRRPGEADRNKKGGREAKEEEDVQGDASSHEQLMSAMLQCDSVLAQMDLLYETMRLSDAELESREEVCNYLHSVLNPYFPTCTIHQFGSSVNGFGMKGCDMDIFLDLHDTDVSLQWEETLRHKLKPVNLPYIREIQALKTTEGPLMPSQLRQLSLVHRVKLMSRIVMQHAHQCSQVLFVPSQRCPIVRFVHSPTGIKCDLSINNRLALRNTQLLRMCGEDRRVRLLVFAVRYWGRHKQVAGNQNCGPRLSNYCLSLLVLFHLANTTPPLLPSVQALVNSADQKCVIENWDCSLPEAVPLSPNTQPADDLLCEFFRFYHGLSLSSSVILTRTGTVTPLNDFLMEKANDPQLNDFKVKALAVQDPFVLHHNIAQNISNQIRDLILQELEYAASKTTKWSPPQPPSSSNSNTTTTTTTTTTTQTGPQQPSTSAFNSEASTSSSSSSQQPLWGLPYIFSTQDCTPLVSENADASSSWCETPARDAATKKSKLSSQWTYPISLDLATLPHQTLQALRAKGDYRAVWFRRVRTLLVWALREVFLFALKTDKDGGSIETVEEEEEEEEEEEREEEGMCVEEESGGGSVEGRAGDKTGKAGSPGSQSLDASVEKPGLWRSLDDLTWVPLRCVQGLNLPPGGGEDPKPPEGKMGESSALERANNNATSPQSVTGKDKSELTLSAGAVMVGGGEDGGGVLSPRLAHSCSMNSPGEPPASSPMSEVYHHSPETCEGKHSPTTTFSSLPCQHSRSNSNRDVCEPCSQLSPSSEKNCAHENVCSKAPSTSSECCDVDMVVDSEDGSATPAPNHMDSSTVPGDKRNVPNAGESGGGEGRSVLPLGMEFNVVCGGTMVLNAKPDVRSCKSSQHSDALNSSTNTANKTGQTLSNKPAANAGNRCQMKKCRPFRVYCEGKHKAWQGRKPIRSILISEGRADDLELEKLISKQIAERDTDSATALPLRFYCTLSPVAKGNKPEAELAFEPGEALPKEFSVFPSFFKSFFTKLVSKNLTEKTPTV